MATFNEDEIRRTDLPEDVFGILHDLAWSHVSQQEWKWQTVDDGARCLICLLVGGSFLEISKKMRDW